MKSLIVPLSRIISSDVGRSQLSNNNLNDAFEIPKFMNVMGDDGSDSENDSLVKANKSRKQEYTDYGFDPNEKIYRVEDPGDRDARKMNTTFQDQCGDELILALSGGGIRSAMFQTGVIKGLKKAFGTLSVIRAVSTVSGGGYTGTGWLSFITRLKREANRESRSSFDAVEELDKTTPRSEGDRAFSISPSRRGSLVDRAFERFYSKMKAQSNPQHFGPLIAVIIVINAAFAFFMSLALSFLYYATLGPFAGVTITSLMQARQGIANPHDRFQINGTCEHVDFFSLSYYNESVGGSTTNLISCYLPDTSFFKYLSFTFVATVAITMVYLFISWIINYLGAYCMSTLRSSNSSYRKETDEFWKDLWANIAGCLSFMFLASWLLYLADLAAHQLKRSTFGVFAWLSTNYGLPVFIVVNVYIVLSIFGFIPKFLAEKIVMKAVEYFLLLLLGFQMITETPYLVGILTDNLITNIVIIVSPTLFVMIFEPHLFHFVNNYYSENLRRMFYCNQKEIDERYLSEQSFYDSQNRGEGFDILVNSVVQFRHNVRLMVFSQKKSYLLPNMRDKKFFRFDSKYIEQRYVDGKKSKCQSLSTPANYPQMHHIMGASGAVIAVTMGDYTKVTSFIFKLAVWMTNLGLGRWVDVHPELDVNQTPWYGFLPYGLRRIFAVTVEIAVLFIAAYFRAMPYWLMAYMFYYLIVAPLVHRAFVHTKFYRPFRAILRWTHSMFLWRHLSLIATLVEEWRATKLYCTDGGHHDNLGLLSALHYVCCNKKMKKPRILCSDGSHDTDLSQDSLIKALELAQSPEYGMIKGFKLNDIPIGILSEGTAYWKTHTAPGLPKKSEDLNRLRIFRVDIQLYDDRPCVLYYIRLIVLGTEKNKNVGLFWSQRDGFPFTSTTNQNFDWGLAQRYRVLGRDIGEELGNLVYKEYIPESHSPVDEKSF